MPAELAIQYTTPEEISALISDDCVTNLIDDNQDGDVSDPPEIDFFQVSAVNIATAEVNSYLLSRYTAEQLETNWLVRDWCTVLAAYWLSKRRRNPIPESIAECRDEAITRMEAIANNQDSIGGLAERESDQPTLSNMTLDMRYRLKQVRVERPISIRRNSPIPATPHYPSDVFGAVEG